MSKVPTKDKPQVLRTIKKVVSRKAKPTENISVELLKDSDVGEYLRLFLGYVGGTANEIILHRPIGVTDLDKDEWVLSSPEEISHLKARSEDPNKPSILAERASMLREEAVNQNLLKLVDGNLTYPSNGMVRSAYIAGLKKKHEDAHQNQKDYKFILDLALAAEDPKDLSVQNEIAYRQWLKQYSPVIEKVFPLNYRTLKGPLADTPQAPISWLKGKRIGEVSNSVLKYGIEGPTTTIGKKTNHGGYTTEPGAAWGKWFFFTHPNEDKKEEAREMAQKICELLGGDCVIAISDE